MGPTPAPLPPPPASESTAKEGARKAAGDQKRKEDEKDNEIQRLKELVFQRDTEVATALALAAKEVAAALAAKPKEEKPKEQVPLPPPPPAGSPPPKEQVKSADPPVNATTIMETGHAAHAGGGQSDVEIELQRSNLSLQTAFQDIESRMNMMIHEHEGREEQARVEAFGAKQNYESVIGSLREEILQFKELSYPHGSMRGWADGPDGSVSPGRDGAVLVNQIGREMELQDPRDTEGEKAATEKGAKELAKLNKKVDRLTAEKKTLKGHVDEAKRLFYEQQNATNKAKEEAAILELQVADLNDLCNAKSKRVDTLKQQGIESEKKRVEVLKAAKQSIRAAALKFQSQAALAEQAISDNQVLKEELLSAHRVMESFKDKARRLTYMKRELAELRAEMGAMAGAQMEIEERAAMEVGRCREEVARLQARKTRRGSRGPSPASRIGSPLGKTAGFGVQTFPSPARDGELPPVRGASPSPSFPGSPLRS